MVNRVNEGKNEELGSGSSVAGFPQRVGKVVMWLRPDGWQTKARRNAWAAMVADRQRRTERVSLAREPRLVMPPTGLRAQLH